MTRIDKIIRLINNVSFSAGALCFVYLYQREKLVSRHEKSFVDISPSDLARIKPLLETACKNCDFEPDKIKLTTWKKACFSSLSDGFMKDTGLICVPTQYFTNYEQLFKSEDLDSWSIKRLKKFENFERKSLETSDEELVYIFMYEIENLKKTGSLLNPLLLILPSNLTHALLTGFEIGPIFQVFPAVIVLLLWTVCVELFHARTIDDKLIKLYDDPSIPFTAVTSQRLLMERLCNVETTDYFELPGAHRTWFLNYRLKQIFPGDLE
ncbi:hypothetical protein RF11_06198 [Thelohanellus kitauei]|uniref:Uncharacterized protein n=1 Tax=Thelohanellus kitauei TaxID=669202 RepID=A0A0C2J3N3_THEKT|nr:hypothetical protein RF11_06198 [Thelohanellus kitauei]